jgi:ribosomal protein S25
MPKKEKGIALPLPERLKLKEDEKAKIARVFDRVVKERVSEQLDTIVSESLVGIIVEAKRKIDKRVASVTKAVQSVHEEQIKASDAKIGKYVEHLVAKTLPEQLVAQVKVGLACKESLDKIGKALANQKPITESVKQEAKKEIAEGGQNRLNALKYISETFKPVRAKAIETVLFETIKDWKSVTAREITRTISQIDEEITAQLREEIDKRKTIKEDRMVDRRTLGKGRVAVASDGEFGLPIDCAIESMLESFAPGRTKR